MKNWPQAGKNIIITLQDSNCSHNLLIYLISQLRAVKDFAQWRTSIVHAKRAILKSKERKDD
jgi:hypothetical protein